MMWITWIDSLSQIVKFSGNLLDTRKTHMLPSCFFAGKKKPPRIIWGGMN